MTNNDDPEEIEFGAMQESTPERGARPESDPRQCVVACQVPSENDLPIYVDLDVAKDIQKHAYSDTRVELGGVLMGTVFHDEDGKPFVVVSDSIRAQHYEATKGSFKFTHETWQAISRRRDEFPEHVRMLGWYHTHPDWGVFLSGMDLFICQNFFAGPHDLALVVDPCRHDVGWFQWTTGREHPQRTGGFYLLASRHRELEAREMARHLEGKAAMSFETHYSNPPVSQPVIIQPAARSNASLSPIEAGFVIALLLQTALVAVIAWRLVAVDPSPPITLNSGAAANSADIVRLEQLSLARQQVIDRLLKQLPDADAIAKDLPMLQARANELEGKLEGQERALVAVTSELTQLETERGQMEQQLVNRTVELRELQAEHRAAHDRMLNAEGALADLRTSGRSAFVWYSDWLYLLGLAVAAIVGALIGAAAISEWWRRRIPEPIEYSRPDSFEPLAGATNERTT